MLLSKGRGKECDLGEFRRSQNWIGRSWPSTAAFVLPPPNHVQDCMGKLELFLHDQPEKTPVLIKAALAHVQFETIHPFLDGNGWLGRLIITLLLCSEKVLKELMLYLSLYFKTQLSPATVNVCLRELERIDIVKEVTGQKRNRLYSYVEYIRIMNEGTELPS